MAQKAWETQRLQAHRLAQQAPQSSKATASASASASASTYGDIQGERLLWVGDLGYEVTDEILETAFTQVQGFPGNPPLEALL